MLFLSGLLHAERVRRGTRTGTRALSTYQQAVLALRWLFDDTRMSQLARDNDISSSTAYDYRDEAITVLAVAHAVAARGAAGRQDRRAHPRPPRRLADRHRPDRHPGPDPRVDLWWSGKHRHHGGNIQSCPPRRLAAVDLAVRPGREHDTTAARADPHLLTQITAWVDDGQLGLADLATRRADLFRIPIRNPPSSS